ncbi:MAG: stress response translation initiation inhibitor YciH [Candidatus Aenigmatarchaeota archaeon]
MEKEMVKIRITTVKRSFGKFVTIVSGLTENTNPKEITKKLKQELACGGTYKNGNIELQGNHAEKIKQILIKLGFNPEQIEVS